MATDAEFLNLAAQAVVNPLRLGAKMDIDALHASRELDALVAEKVMGWHRRKDFWATENEWDSQVAPGDWSPSTSIAAAWEVVEKLRSLRELFFINRDENGLWEVEVCDRYENRQARQAVAASADTAPLAICRAALKAVGENA